MPAKRRTRATEKQLSNRKKILLLTFLGIIVIYVLWSNSLSTNAPNALYRASKLLEENKLDEAQSLLSVAEQEKSLSDWSTLARAQLLEKRGETQEALALYGELSHAGAVSLDAKVALLRIGPGLLRDVPNVDPALLETESFIQDLGQNIKEAFRDDLLPVFMLARAQYAEEEGDMENAILLYQDVRERFPKSAEAEIARKALAVLYQSKRGASTAERSLFLTREARLLLIEGESLAALEKIQQAKELLTPTTKPFFDAGLLEDEILRRLGRNNEADRLLLLISADGTPDTADQALFRVIKNTWNVNNHYQALEYVDSFRHRFPESPLLSEVNYIEARIDEEISELADAENMYESIAKSDPDVFKRVRALRRIAWLYLQSGEYSRAAKFFARGVQLIDQGLRKLRTQMSQTLPSKSEETPTSLRQSFHQLREELPHSLFWLSYSLQHDSRSANEEKSEGNNGKTKDAKKKPSSELVASAQQAAIAAERLQSEFPHSYYALRASQQKLDKNSLAQEVSSNDPLKQNLSKECRLSLPREVRKRIRLLSKAHLPEYAARELEWFFYRHPVADDLRDAILRFPEHTLNTLQMKLLATKANYYRKLARPERVIEIVQVILRHSEMATLEPSAEHCLSEWRSLSHPILYLDDFRSAATEYQVPTALLLALARTESHLNPQAVSSKGAVGLLQLMPATAQQEGLQEGQSLEDPAINIPLAAKHFSQLLKEYGNELSYSIAAYNAGRAAVNRWKTRYPDLDPLLWSEIISYPETNAYVKKVLLAAAEYQRILESRKPKSS